MRDNKVDQIPWILKSFANTAKKGSIIHYALPHYWIMAGTLKSFPSWCRKMGRVNSVVSKLSLALLYATCGPFFVVLFKLQQSMLYFALSYTSFFTQCLWTGLLFQERSSCLIFPSWGLDGREAPSTGVHFDKLALVLTSSYSLFSFFFFFVSDGQFFTWGQNSYGQLGLGKECPSQASPQRVKSLDGIPLAQVAAGGAHSFALSLSGAVFGWGKNSSGQLGLSDERGIEIMLFGERRMDVFLAEWHSFIFWQSVFTEQMYKPQQLLRFSALDRKTVLGSTGFSWLVVIETLLFPF